MEPEDQDSGVMFRFLTEIAIIAQLSGNALEGAMPEGMTMPQFVVLNHLIRTGGGRTPLELARAVQVTKGAMTNTLGHLERAGHVAIRPDPADRRSKRVDLTEEGRRARDAALAAIAPELRALAERFPADTLRGALPLLEAVRAALDARRNRGGG